MPNYKDANNKVHFIDSTAFEYLLPTGCVPITDEEAAELNRLPAPDPSVVEQQRIDALWQAAHDYEFAQVSGSAIGLLAMGVMQNKVKCIAVQDWIKGIWTEYYTRKANGSTDYDYSFAGPVPYSVPELMAELGL